MDTFNICNIQELVLFLSVGESEFRKSQSGLGNNTELHKSLKTRQ